MRPFAANGQVWRVIRVPAGDPSLVDRTDTVRLATTNPATRVISINEAVVPPLLDKVLLHEIAHAITVSWGMLPRLRSEVMRRDLTGVEEWSAQLIENHAIEAIRAASDVLGRPVCIYGSCLP